MDKFLPDDNQVNKWHKYHAVTNLQIDALKGTLLKSYLLRYRKKTKFLKHTLDRLLGIPSLPENVRRILDIGCGSGYTLMLLRHLYENLETYGVDIFKVLKPGGIFHILTENYTSLFLPTFLMSKHTINFWDDYTHVRPYTRKALTRLYQRFNFIDIKVRTYRSSLIVLSFPIILLAQLAGRIDAGRLLFEIFAPDLCGEAKKDRECAT